MSCYLCAYLRTESPEEGQVLPHGSPVGTYEDLGTCYMCSIWACSAHGTRYAKFECAICTPATAADDAMSANAVGGPAAVLAHLVGMNSSRALYGQVTVALQKVVTASQQPTDEVSARSLVAPLRGEPNLIINLAEEIRHQQFLRGETVVRAIPVDGEAFGPVSLDAIGGAVRARFTGRMLAAPTEDAVTTATGALLLGYSLAERDVAGRRQEDPIGWPPGIDGLRRPWQVSRPIFLDPVLWMLGTALPEN